MKKTHTQESNHVYAVKLAFKIPCKVKSKLFSTVGLADVRPNGPGLTIFRCTLSPNPLSKTATHFTISNEWVIFDLP